MLAVGLFISIFVSLIGLSLLIQVIRCVYYLSLPVFDLFKFLWKCKVAQFIPLVTINAKIINDGITFQNVFLCIGIAVGYIAAFICICRLMKNIRNKINRIPFVQELQRARQIALLKTAGVCPEEFM